MQIGPHVLATKVVLAPMAGVTDSPFRAACLRFGAGLTVSEMVSSKQVLQDSMKSQSRRMKLPTGLHAVQLLGNDPAELAAAAQYHVATGADIIDLNMGCPAKKVNRVLAGSALLQDPKLVEAICTAVVKAVPVPVTLKIRTGWDVSRRNGVEIGRIAQGCGIQALAVHGRTRACFYQGDAEYETIRAIKAALNIPVIANGDINTPAKAQWVLDYTKADGVMIGRAAQGQPWIFYEINHWLTHGTEAPPLATALKYEVIREHLAGVYALYGEALGVKIARKHVGWYAQHLSCGNDFRRRFNELTCAATQQLALDEFFFSQPN